MCETRFWEDRWLGEGELLKVRFPRLYSLEVNKTVLVSERLGAGGSVSWCWRRSLFVWELNLVESLTDLLSRVTIDDNLSDSWTWQKAAGHTYTVAEEYKQIVREMDDAQEHIVAWSEMIWIRWTPQRLKFFVWRVLLDRIATLRNLKRRRILGDEESTACRLCESQEDESVFHIFFTCSFANSVWKLILSWLDLRHFVAGNCVNWLETFATLSLPKSNKAWFAVFHGTLWLSGKRGTNLFSRGRLHRLLTSSRKLKLIFGCGSRTGDSSGL